MDIINAQRDKIVLISGAHIHRSEMRMPMSIKYPDLKIPLLVSQAVTPIYMNNPGYTTIQISGK